MLSKFFTRKLRRESERVLNEINDKFEAMEARISKLEAETTKDLLRPSDYETPSMWAFDSLDRRATLHSKVNAIMKHLGLTTVLIPARNEEAKVEVKTLTKKGK